MGYDIHITRKENWFDEVPSNEIKLAEWTEYIRSDNEMRIDNQASTTSIEKETHRTMGLAVWTTYSKNGLENNYAWFYFCAGNVIVKNPDREIINKMIDIATQLNARVQGDDGEVYNTKSLTDDNSSFTKSKPWWKIWIVFLAIFCVSSCDQTSSSKLSKKETGISKILATIDYKYQGCFGGGSQKLVLIDNIGNKTLILKTGEQEMKRKSIDEGEINIFFQFIDELKKRNFGSGCTTTAYYSILVGTEYFNKTDGSCSWNGFNSLTRSLFYR